jgi:hypothetical protein
MSVVIASLMLVMADSFIHCGPIAPSVHSAEEFQRPPFITPCMRKCAEATLQGITAASGGTPCGHGAP